MPVVRPIIDEDVKKKRSPGRLKQYLLHRKLLLRNGYKESQKKPNLFYRKQSEDIIFFADMRETRVPYFYYRVLNKKYLIYPYKNRPDFYYLDWRLYRFTRSERNTLKKAGIALSHWNVSDESCEMDGYSGFCGFCGKDLRDNREFCDSACETHYGLEHGFKQSCKVCKNIFNKYEMIRHHINYENDKTVLVCKSCHTRIHKTDLHPELKPTDKRPAPTNAGVRKQRALEKVAVNRRFVRHILQLTSKARKTRPLPHPKQKTLQER